MKRPRYKFTKGMSDKQRKFIWRQLLMQKLSDGDTKCVKCKFNDIRALQIDHINNDGFIEKTKIFRYDEKYYFQNNKLFRLNHSSNDYYYWVHHIKLAKEKFQVLCANCNAIKKHEAINDPYGIIRFTNAYDILIEQK